MNLTKEQLQEAHKLSSNNYSIVMKSVEACCFYCCKRFKVNENTIFLPSNERKKIIHEPTAFHVDCGVDAVIADSQTELARDMKFVAAMRYYWFDIDSPYESTEEENG